jgi:hypothetical protein
MVSCQLAASHARAACGQQVVYVCNTKEEMTTKHSTQCVVITTLHTVRSRGGRVLWGLTVDSELADAAPRGRGIR